MIALFLAGVAVVLLLHGYLYGRTWSRALSVRVLFSCPHICAFETCELAEIIENRKRMALPLLEIGFRIPKGLAFQDAENTVESDYVYKRDLFAVQGMERIVRRYHITAQKRGCYAVSQLTCHAPSRLFMSMLMMDRSMQEDETGLYVYAANTDCSFLLHAVETILGERESARRVYEDPFAFSSIRPYTIQDPMKSINWKATAKTGDLMVNTFASTTAVRVKIFLDVSVDPGNPFGDSLRELGIAMAASLIRILVKQQRDAELVMNCLPANGTQEAQSLQSCVRFVSCLNAQRLTAMEEFLTSDFDACPLLSFEEMLSREHAQSLRQSTGSEEEVSVFLTAMDSPSLRSRIQELLGMRRSGILAVLSRTADRRETERERNLHIIPVFETSRHTFRL